VKETYSCDSCLVILNWRALPKLLYLMVGPPGTFVVLGSAMLAIVGVATRVGLRTEVGATRVGSRTRPLVLAATTMVLRASPGTATMASHARCRSHVSTPARTADGGISVLGGGGATGSSSSDMSDSTIYHIWG
jgi:heme/copper-type cytochrome/quinol oxidase subunit 3